MNGIVAAVVVVLMVLRTHGHSQSTCVCVCVCVSTSVSRCCHSAPSSQRRLAANKQREARPRLDLVVSFSLMRRAKSTETVVETFFIPDRSIPSIPSF